MSDTVTFLLEQSNGTRTRVPEMKALSRSMPVATPAALELVSLRELSRKTQSEVADVLGITQPTVAGMEKRGHNLKLSSLKRYVAATGATLHLAVELPDGSRYQLEI